MYVCYPTVADFPPVYGQPQYIVNNSRILAASNLATIQSVGADFPPVYRQPQYIVHTNRLIK